MAIITAQQLWNQGECHMRLPNTRKPTVKAKPVGGPDDMLVVNLARPSQIVIQSCLTHYLIEYQARPGQPGGPLQLVTGDAEFEIVIEKDQSADDSLSESKTAI